jgi:ribosomal protein S18 acetylase RimI-like enzyme
MSHRGRFGKYGETKRFARLRQSGMRHSKGRSSEDNPRPGDSTVLKPRDRRGRVYIREAVPSDEGFIIRLSAKVFSIYGPYGETIGHWLELGTTITLIALEEGKPAGFGMVGALEPDLRIPTVTELLAIAVEPSRQRMGIGQVLLREIEKKTASLGEKKLFLHTATENVAAQKLFIKNAYRPQEMKRKFYPKGQDALMMVKEIDISG